MEDNLTIDAATLNQNSTISYSPIHSISFDPANYSVDLPSDTKDNLFKEFIRELTELSFKPTFKYQCNNCGGTLEMDIDNHIFNCPYCDTVYAIGLNNINA